MLNKKKSNEETSENIYSTPTINPYKIIKIYNRGKFIYYLNAYSIIILTNCILFYFGLSMLELELFHLSRKDYLYLGFYLFTQLFITKNILLPVIGNWKDIENKYHEIMMDETIPKDNEMK